MSHYAEFKLLPNQIREKNIEQERLNGRIRQQREQYVMQHGLIELQNDYFGMDIYYLHPVTQQIWKTRANEFPCTFVTPCAEEVRHIKMINNL